MTVSPDHPIVSNISDSVARHVKEWLGNGARLESPTPQVQRRAWSFFLRYAVQGSGPLPTALFVKIHSEPHLASLDEALQLPHLKETARQEFQTLCAVDAAFSGAAVAGCAAVRPFAFLESWNAIVMEEVAARSLKQELLRPRMMLGQDREWIPFQEAMGGAGLWLRRFHEQVGRLDGEQGVDVPALRDEATRALEPLQAAVGAGQLDRVRAALERRLAQLEGSRTPIALMHGDFNCANILVSPERTLYVLDPNAITRRPVYEDLARLLTDLMTRKVQVFTGGAWVRSGRLQGCRAALLQGYFGTDSPNLGLLDLYAALAILHKWAANESQLAGGRAGPHGWLARLVMRRYFLRVLHTALA